MKFLKLFENFEEPNLHDYCEDYWDVDPEFLFELIQYELEDNSLKKMRFLLENEDKRNMTVVVFDKNKLSLVYPVEIKIDPQRFKEYWNEFIVRLKRVNKERPYPAFKGLRKIDESDIYKTSVYYEDKYSTYFPEIQLGFDKSSIIEDGNIGGWEDHFNSIFKKVGIPYLFDGDNGYFESDMVWYTLYHT